MKNSITLHFTIFFVACGGIDSDKSLGKRSDFPDQESWNPVIVMTREAKKRAIVRSKHLAKYSIADGKNYGFWAPLLEVI